MELTPSFFLFFVFIYLFIYFSLLSMFGLIIKLRVYFLLFVCNLNAYSLVTDYPISAVLCLLGYNNVI